MLNKVIKTTLFVAVLTVMPATEAFARFKTREKSNTENVLRKDSISGENNTGKKSFLYTVSAPLRWIYKNWSAYNPKYSTPSFYTWSGQAYGKLTKEWLDITFNEYLVMNMHSDASVYVGPYLSYKWVGYGLSLNFAALENQQRRKNEFSLSINSNLMNINFIRRRTGGDFTMSKMTSVFFDKTVDDYQITDVTSRANAANIGDYIKYDVTGLNLNFFTNFRKYSNPAAFGDGAVQRRSAGSPIVGLGYLHQRVENSCCDIIENYCFDETFKTLNAKDNGTPFKNLLSDFNSTFNTSVEKPEELTRCIWSTYDSDVDTYRRMVGKVISNADVKPILFGERSSQGTIKDLGALPALSNQIPSTIIIDSWHLNLGYAFNLVFSRRLLLGLSAVVSPSIKHVRMDNRLNMVNICADEFSEVLSSYYKMQYNANDFRYSTNEKRFGTDFSGRASLTYNFNRWRAGINANVDGYLYKNSDTKVNSIYGSVNLYVGYCFGRRPQYRWNGSERQTYVMAALTKKQMEEMQDTMPRGNLATNRVLRDGKNTKYHTDVVDMDVGGCDLVKGPDGTYGSYTLEDGYITPGQDSEGRLRPGTVIPVRENGSIVISCGHSRSIRAANWWKSQLALRQTPNNWYPEVLQYALRGKLVLWVRSYAFGTIQPVRLVIDDFCISRGTDSKSFFQIACKHYSSHSSYSIIGNESVNDRKVRIYIESKKDGYKNYIYTCPMKASNLVWMADLPDTIPVSRVSVPGTHDAGSSSLPEGKFTSMGHTQNLDIAEQLEDGIRAFDIRLKEDMKFGHTMDCRDSFIEALDSIDRFLKANPSEFVVAMIGSDEGGEWSDVMKKNFCSLMDKHPGLFVDKFSSHTPVGDVRGKVLVIKRQEECPFGKLLTFQNNTIFEDNGFCVEDVYKEHKTYKKIKIVERHIRNAHECLGADKWYLTFNSIAWDPRHHKPYYSAWGAVNVRKPMNPSLREIIELKKYNNFGIVFLDFYNDHCDRPQLVESIIKSNFNTEVEKDFIPMPGKIEKEKE